MQRCIWTFCTLVVAMAAASGCLDHGTFRCTSNSQCGSAGLCESTNACSFPVSTTTCASGRRYGVRAPDALSNQCVRYACPDNPVVRVRGGGSHACEVRQQGTVACWGAGTDGQLGDGLVLSRGAPAAVAGLPGAARDVATGGRHTCAVLDPDGAVWCWGANESGQLGDNTTTSRAKPVPVLIDGNHPLTAVAAIAAGSAFTCAALTAGGTLCWGGNANAQLGQGTISVQPVATPQAVGGMLATLAVRTLAARDRHACALTMDGAVWCWGSSEQGELGTGFQDSPSLPRPVAFPSPQSIDEIAVGAAHTCAVGGGLLWCWGADQLGQLGDGGDQNQLFPVSIPLTQVSGVAAGTHHTCARQTDGTAWCWGANQAGQLGEGTTSNFAVPVPVTGIEDATDLTAGDVFSCARRRDGTVWCWGDDRLGQLGIGGAIEQLTAPATSDPNATGATAISAGGTHTCAIRQQDGGAQTFCWGDNQAGQIGDGTRLDRSTPVPLKINLDAVQVAAGASHTCLRGITGAVWCWGRGGSGQLGTPSFIDVIVPTSVPTLGETTRIAAGQSHTCAILKDQTVWCWGANTDGQLGDGTTNSRSTPAVVTGQAGVVELALGAGHTCARHADATVSCWGRGTNGQLGDDTGNSSALPVAVKGLDGAVQIAAGDAHSCAMLTDHTVACWGAGTWGQLGWGTPRDHGIPSKVMNVANAVEVAAGGNHTCARTASDERFESPGSVYCWGDNRAGQLGNGTHDPDRGMGPPAGERPAIDGDALGITAGDVHTCAIRRDRGVVCWGANSAGQLGNATKLQYPTPQSARAGCPP